ncbi:4249_t:CDS:2 [Entrophospora sp. SA101]|nr:4198_t:CDS:2 [Entrophospora sp. SA101]CAJ0842800.1 4249_t:CDS:2 [Entrophospora sp. SA101]
MYSNKYSAPTSPTLSARTSSSITHSIRTAEPISNPSVILTRTDIRSSIEAYEQLLAAAKIYRNQLMALAQATANFGQSLERIAHCKGALESGSSFQAAAGLHYLTSNHQQLLSDALYKNFEIPLLENLDVHKSTVFASEENYDKSLAEMSKKIKETEAENLRIGRKRQRDLTRQVEDLDRLKAEYHRQTLENEQNNLKYILSKVSTVVKAEVDIFDRISSKGLADPLLEAMTTQSPDPFCTYQTADQFSEIFSILPPVPIINNTVDISSTTTSILNDFSNDGFQTHSSKNSSQKEAIDEEDGDSDEAQGIFKGVISSHYLQSQKIFSDVNSNNIDNNIKQSSINSVISPFDQHFNKSNKSVANIPNDADILNNKEFKFEDGVIENSS